MEKGLQARASDAPWVTMLVHGWSMPSATRAQASSELAWACGATKGHGWEMRPSMIGFNHDGESKSCDKRRSAQLRLSSEEKSLWARSSVGCGRGGGGVTIPFQASRQAPRFLFSPSLLLAAAITGPNEHPSRPWARKCHRSDTKLSSWRRPTITRGAWQGRGLERERESRPWSRRCFTLPSRDWRFAWLSVNYYVSSCWLGID